MYYILYLSSLCRRRRWPDPLYTCQPYNTGYACSVRVNGRDYNIDASPQNNTQDLAREAAAMHAYLICRNLSAADHAAEVERKEHEERERERQLQPAYGRPEYAMLSQQALTGGGYLARRGS